jgi:N-acetylmuramoyl-L-alanine amidase
MIFVSAGHHASKPGASYKGFCEFDEAVVWADLMIDKLGAFGIRVPSGFLRDKVDFINARNPVDSVAIEIHFNAAVDSNGNNIGRGCETLYFPGSESGKKIATTVNDALAEVFPPNRGVKEGWYRMNKKNGPDFFLARTKCPAIIIEPDFIHRKDIIQNGREEACQKMVDALVRVFE